MNFKTSLIDERAALKSLDDNRQLLCELAQIFVEDAPILLQEMEAAVDKGDLDIARRKVHSLRGVVATFFAKSITEQASRLEAELSFGTMDPLRNGGAQELTIAVHRVIDELLSCGLARRNRP